MNSYQTLATPTNYQQPPSAPFVTMIELAYVILMVVGLWKVFEKAGEEGWKAIIPVYNLYILLKVVRQPGWWLILYFIPVVNIVIAIVVAIDLAKVFGKDTAFGFFLNFLIPIGPILLGFGDAKYSRNKSK